jgi:hypothetical protein
VAPSEVTQMKHAIPVKMLITGPMALGLVSAVGFMLVFPQLRTPSELLLAFVVGAVGGLVIFIPVAAALAFRKQLRPSAVAQGFTVQRYASIAMVFSLGYLFASAIHHTSDLLTGLAVLSLFFGALAKIVFGIIFCTRQEPPSDGGGGPRPPLAPVLRPTGGRPPTLSAAAKVEHQPAG